MKIKKLINIFFSPSFLIFCLIGILNTLIHLAVYNLVITIPFISIYLLVIIGNTLAFITASLFSYWANATFTYKQKASKLSFSLAMLTFIIRLLLSDLIIHLFNLIIEKENWLFLRPWAPLPATALLIPLQFLVFNKIFTSSQVLKKTLE